MGELHSSKTARFGNIPTNAVTKGIHADTGPFKASQEVWCQQCGFRCNLERDARNINEFAGEAITKGDTLTNGSFEDWTAGNPDDWTVSGTVTQETTAGFFDNVELADGSGSSSVKITRSGSDISLSQALGSLSNFNDNTVIFGARVKSETNDVIRLKITINSIEHISFYNVAGQRFENLSLLVKAPSSVSSLTVAILADNADGTAYVDNATLMRSGNPTTASVQAGCPHCGSFNYSNRPPTLVRVGIQPS